MLVLRALLFNIFGYGTIMVLAAVVLITFWAPRSFHWWICLTWCRMAVWSLRVFCGIDIVIEGRENIPDEPSVIMIKHTSTFETFWHVTAFPRTSWVLKREMLWVPVMGWAISLALHPIGIDRSAGGRAVKQVIQQGKERLARGVWVTIFPEGTRVPPGETRKYGISGAALARDAGVRIVPVAHNAGDLWPRKSFIKRPGTVRVRIGPTINAAGRPPKETNLIVQDWIEAQMQEISCAYQEGNQ